MGCGTSQSLIQKKNTISALNDPSCYLWKEYKSTYKNLSQTSSSKTHKLHYNNKTIEFEFTIVGEKPLEGYPLFICLHDGEVSHGAYNTGEYKKMKTYYLKSITNGICLACRGISDQSNFHYMDESFVLIEKVIKEMIVLYDADPLRVYLIGVGLGGNAVYQLAARLPDRFAALSVNSGHTLGLNLKNLINIPIQIQVGENDIMFEKNKNAVNAFCTLCDLYKEYDIQTTTIECNIHTGKGKHIIDYNIKRAIQNVVNDPVAWLNAQEYSSIPKNTNAILFLSQFKRNSFPQTIVWDVTKCFRREPASDNFFHSNKKMTLQTIPTINFSTKSDLQMDATLSHLSGNSTVNNKETRIENSISFSNCFCYWLETGNKNINEIGAVEIIAHLEKENNKIVIETPVKYIRVLLCQDFIDFDREVTIEIGKESKTLKVMRNFATERRCISERGDYIFIFSAAVVIESTDLVQFKIYQFAEQL